MEDKEVGDREEGNKGVRKQGSGGEAGELGKQWIGWSRKTNAWKKRGLGNRGVVKVLENKCGGMVNSKKGCREKLQVEKISVCVCV